MDVIQLAPAVSVSPLLCDSPFRGESPSPRSTSPGPMSTELSSGDNGGGLPNPCRHVLQELIDTERVYVQALREVTEGYIDPMTNQTFLPISADDREALFSNTTELCKFSGQLTREFDDAGHNLEKLAACFHRNEGGFKMYTDYCNNYPRAVEILAEAQRQPMMSEFFRGCQLALGHMLPLGAFLLKPVQRILKYHLLLADLLKQYGKHVGKTDEAYQELSAAQKTMAGVAEYINAMKRKHELSVRTQEIVSQVVGWDTKVPVGLLVLDDSFRVQGARDRRIIYLFERVMLITKRSKDGIIVYKGHLNFQHMLITEHLKDPLSWDVSSSVHKDFHFVIVAKNAQQKQRWLSQLRQLIIDNNPDLSEALRERMRKSLDKDIIKNLTKVPETVVNLPAQEPAKNESVQSETDVINHNEANKAEMSENANEASSPLPFARGRRVKKPAKEAREVVKRKLSSQQSSETEGNEQDEVSSEEVLRAFDDGSTEVSGTTDVGTEGGIDAALVKEVPIVRRDSHLDNRPESGQEEELFEGLRPCSPCLSPSPSTSDLLLGTDLQLDYKPPSTPPTSDTCDSDDEVSELMVDQVKPNVPAETSTLSDAPDIMVPESHIKEFHIQPKLFQATADTPPIHRRVKTIKPRARAAPKTWDVVDSGRTHRHSVHGDRLRSKAPSAPTAGAAAPENSAEVLAQMRGLVHRLVKRYTELVKEDEEVAAAEGVDSREALPSSGSKDAPRLVAVAQQVTLNAAQARARDCLSLLPARQGDFQKMEKKIATWAEQCRRQPCQRAAVNVKRSRSLVDKHRSLGMPLKRHHSVACLHGRHQRGVSFACRLIPSGEKRSSRRAMFQVFSELRRDNRRIVVKSKTTQKKRDAAPTGRVRRLIEKFSVQPM